jgi:hypothetical protein
MTPEERRTEREKVRKKIQWYCYQMRIPEPTTWTHKEVLKVVNKINKKEKVMLVCRDCNKIDVSYPHDNCDPEYEAYREESNEYYD